MKKRTWPSWLATDRRQAEGIDEPGFVMPPKAKNSPTCAAHLYIIFSFLLICPEFFTLFKLGNVTHFICLCLYLGVYGQASGWLSVLSIRPHPTPSKIAQYDIWTLWQDLWTKPLDQDIFIFVSSSSRKIEITGSYYIFHILSPIV